MLIIPFEIRHSERGPLVLVVVLQKDNLDRMKQGDPVDVNFADYDKFLFSNRPVGQLDLVIAYEEDVDKLMDFKRKGDIMGLINWLERGRKIRADDLAAPRVLK